MNDSDPSAAQSLPATDVTWIVCLCADWCGLCRDYETLFTQMAARYPAFRFAWLDIEDQSGLVGDIDVETFPTVLMADAQGTQFFGPLTPQANTLARLLDSLQSASLRAAPLALATRQLLDALQAAPELWINASDM
ncbi:PUTATIVE THIOREDOXIN-LIKE PROTEIN [Polaromonas sp. CG9_12]|uniref:thioredoxin family protein n=1 Tax=Polaromonas sp. CG_9.11 TaxID=2787730 RepID=UPI0004DDD93F|nr:thioredoxin domain-containing protein [Polaromonas sp. CG_9.11]MBG6076080.1 thioredoxin-like negative regulator of GroEL [Polaromonas sp. CG_9.11]CDS54830.1 PUTATIVE THIOREDOXIN-LIKE PROTEIN [Polaromonas sp. CG9_12]